MTSLSRLNKLKEITIFFTILILNSAFAADPVDIWEKQENQNEQSNQIGSEKEITIESPILSDDINKITYYNVILTVKFTNTPLLKT